MKKIIILFAISVISLFLVYAFHIYSQNIITSDILSGGGTISDNDSLSLSGSTGLFAAGTSSNSIYSLEGGFWQQRSHDVFLPDLTGNALSITGNDTVERDSTYSINYSIKNGGGIPSTDSFRVDIYISYDSTVDSTDVLLHSKNIDTAITASSVLSMTADSITIPDTLTISTYYTGMIIDPQNNIREISETNNIYTSTSGTVIIPVELVNFSFSKNEREQVTLFWTTASEIGNLGFEVEKSSDGKEFSTLIFLKGSGTTDIPHNYTFTDKNTSPGKFFYRLKQINFDGSFSYSPVLEIEISKPDKCALLQNYPNPFNPETTIQFRIAEETFVTLSVYNIYGQELKPLVRETVQPGSYSIIWDGTDKNNVKVASGVYIYVLKTRTGYMDTKKMILLK